MARIANLQDLRAEKLRVATEISAHKAIMKEEVRRLRRRINPIHRLLDWIGIGKDQPAQASARPIQPILKAGANLGIDLLGYRVLQRAGWLTRLVVPLLAKGVSSTFLDRFRKRKSNGQHT